MDMAMLDNLSAAEHRSIAAVETDFRSAEVRLENRAADPTQVMCRGDGLKFGYLSQPICSTIDTRNAGPGELVVYCNGLTNSAFCDLRDHKDGTFTLTVRAQDKGMHYLYVKYDNVDVTGSPFQLRVSSASLVKVRGPGLRDAVMRTALHGEFEVDTSEAGVGDIRVRVGGPRNAFRLQTLRQGKRLYCRYNPRSSGVYVVNVEWSGDTLPGSPYQVHLFSGEQDMRRHRAAKQGAL